MKLRPVAPLGETVSQTTSGPCRTFVYPPSPRGERLRNQRVLEDPYTNLREAARAFGISASQLSALECGRSDPEDPADWDALEQKLRELKEAKR